MDPEPDGVPPGTVWPLGADMRPPATSCPGVALEPDEVPPPVVCPVWEGDAVSLGVAPGAVELPSSSAPASEADPLDLGVCGVVPAAASDAVPPDVAVLYAVEPAPCVVAPLAVLDGTYPGRAKHTTSPANNVH